MGTDDINVPYWADVNSLILIEVGMSADEESLLHSSFEPVFLSILMTVLPPQSILWSSSVLCCIYFSILAVLPVL